MSQETSWMFMFIFYIRDLSSLNIRQMNQIQKNMNYLGYQRNVK